MSTQIHNFGYQSDRFQRRGEGDGRKLKTLNQDQWAIVIIHEAYNLPDKGDSEEDKDLPKASESNNSDLKKVPRVRARRQLRYVLVKRLSQPDSAGNDFLVVDLPSYLRHWQEGRGEQVAEEMDELSGWWAKEASTLAERNVGHYDEDDIQENL